MSVSTFVLKFHLNLNKSECAELHSLQGVFDFTFITSILVWIGLNI